MRTRTWFIISLLFFLAAAVFWQLGERKLARDKAARQAATAATNGPASPRPSAAGTPAVPATVPVKTNSTARVSKPQFPFRLTNTTMSVDQLSRSATGVILRNALIDSSVPLNLNIPAHLRAEGEPGSYVVQSRGPVTDAFRAALQQAGAEIVAYVPNNAYLVRAREGAVRQIGALPQAQAVLPWEPYYKIDPALLESAVKQSPLPSNARLNLLLFPGERDAVMQALSKMEAVVLGEERSPFGWQLMVRPPEDALVSLARLPGVQVIEKLLPRRIANDLSRERVRVSTNTVDTTPNYLGLRGSGVRVNVNDTGVDELHADLFPRVSADFPLTLVDVDGHGTHVAGTIASSGANSPQISDANIPGSVTNADFRGMAPEAEIFALSIDRTFGPDVSDTYLQEMAAATNAFISNNSWGYYGSGTYTLAAASWDAAVRDALPGVTGSQPLVAVFAAGNRGAGGIDAPGTAKNVITVGAIENMRVITNETWIGVAPNQITNQPWLGMTDTNNEIAAFSSLGNVGSGEEGDGGRFKPDVVAPGTFVISTRSGLWNQPSNNVEVISDQISFVRIRAGRTNTYSTFVPENGVRLEVVCVANVDSPVDGLPPLPIQIRAGSTPTEADYVNTNRASVSTTASVPDAWYFSVANTNTVDIFLHIRYFVSLTNDVGNEWEVLDTLNDQLGVYRYESGTSMAAPVVTGVIALMQEYFQSKLQWTNSPALMKALLINGARSVNSAYDFNTTNAVNGQGWGLASLINSLPVSPSGSGGDGIFTSSSMVLYDQDPGRALATGQSFTRTVTVSARTQPLRITLVWTDPPGNPAVGIKLVNNLDLVVKNLDTDEVFVGNGIGGGSIFNDAVDTNSVGFDMVNNVENVYLQGSFNQRLGGRYSVTVTARAVNINAVTAHPAGVVQDYALVISSGNPRTTASISVSDAAAPVIDLAPSVQSVTNGIPLLNQRVGANTPLLVSTNGITNQWKFFVVTNTIPDGEVDAGTAGNYIAFRTFFPPNLGKARIAEADIDLFVSDKADITDLNEATISAAWRGVGRGGSESIVLSNVSSTAYFYAAVKSEDQQAANFGFFAISSSSPFSSTDTNGNVYMRGFPVNVEIPDGAPEDPKAGFMFAFNTEPIVIQNVVVTNVITHENGGDLFGVLEHDGKTSVLNANRSFGGTAQFIYDDSGSGEFADDATTDAPGTLRNFVGEEGVGSWQLTMVDSAPFYTGQVNRLQIRLEPRSEDLTNGVGVEVTIRPGRWWRTAVDVPADTTNLLVCVTQDEGPVEVYIARGFEPDRVDYDTFAVIPPPGDCLSLGKRDVPPLSQGRYFIGVFNPNGTPVNARIQVFIQRDLAARTTVGFRSDSGKELLDDAVTNSVLRVNRPGVIADLSVGVRIAHPRVSDLVMHLVSPQGTRVLLAENRGGPTGADYGVGSLKTNTIPVDSSGGAEASRSEIGPVDTEGVLQVDYQMFGVPDRLTVYYENNLIFDSGLVSGAGTFSIDYGPGTATNLVIIMNEGGNPNSGTAWNYTARVVSGYVFTVFTDDTLFAQVPIKFGIPPFTNFNYFATKYFTNSTLVSDGFEDVRNTPLLLLSPAYVTGWQVASGDIRLMGLESTNAPWRIAPYEGSRFIDVNGTLGGSIVTNFLTVPGIDYQVSFAYARNASNGAATTAAVSVSNANATVLKTTNVVASGATSIWHSGSFLFTADTSNSWLRISSPSGPASGGVFFDGIKVEQVTEKVETAIYYQPEEPMTEQPFGRLVGENAFGNWTLEILDNRVGGSLTNGVLLAWKLNITYVNTNPPTVTLTNGMEFCSTLRSNETAYFLINVPISAGAVTNTVTGSQSLGLLYNAIGLPTDQEPPDTLFFSGVPEGVTVLDGDGWNSFDADDNLIAGAFAPEIRPGRRYYLAVRNDYPGTNAFCIRVDFDSIDPNLAPIIPITNNCLLAGASGFAIDYYSFDVSGNAIGVEFSIANIVGVGDVNLYVTRGLPLPNTSSFDASSTNQAAATGEFILLADFTGALLPGRWYLAVENVGGSPSYEVCAREIPGPVIPISVNFTNPATIGSNVVHYYQVVISSNAYQADFRTIAGNSNVDLYISQDTFLPLLVAPTNAAFASTNLIAPSGDELIRLSVFTNTAPLTPGTWYLAVVNKLTVPVNYSVIVNEYTTNLNYIRLTNGVPYADQVSPSDLVGFYRFDVSRNALQVVFETFEANNDVDLYIRYGFPLPPPGTNQFQFASTNLASGNEWIALTAGNTNALPRAGSYWIAVVAKDPTLTADFKVRATQIRRSEVTQLFNGLDACSVIQRVDTNALHSGVRFYRFDVGTNSVQALFETLNASGNVDLYLQYGLPLTNYSLLTPPAVGGSFTNSDTVSGLESICLLTNSSPIALRGGTWYLAVVNRGSVDVTNCVRASSVEIAPLATGIDQCGFLDLADGSPVGGINYYSFNVSADAVQATFETVFASGNVDLYVTKALPLTNCNTFSSGLGAFTYFSTNAALQLETICLLNNTQTMTLSAGQWYVAVVNRETNSFVRYCLRADQLRTGDFVAATNTVRITATVEPGNGSMSSGIDYYLVTVTNDPVMATFETFDATGNVDLFVSQVDPGGCLPNFATFNPALAGYPYSSSAGGIAPECVTLMTNSSPVVLTNGEWIVAVVNRSATNVSYSFLATQFATDPNLALTNAVARCEQVAPTNGVGSIGVNYYVFTVSANALQATFEVYGANGNVDLYLQNGFCFQNRDTFSLTNVNAAYASTNSGTNAESICLHGGSFPLGLQPGEWNLVVVNRETNNVDFCVRVIEQLDTDIIGLTNRANYSPLIPLTSGGADYYRYRVSPDALQVSVQILMPNADVDLFLDAGFCPENFANPGYSSTNNGITNELITVRLDSVPFPLTPGEWLIAVTNRGPSDAGYTIRVTELFASDVIRLTNAISYANTVAGIGSVNGLPVDYYVYNVSSNAVRAQFEILSPSGNVNLIARKGLPLPTLANSSFVSSNSGTSAELIVIFNSSTPVALTPGDWYFAVLNATAGDVTYSMIATEYIEAGTNVNIGGITLVSNLFCLTWGGVLPGVNYHVQGKANFSAPAWIPVSPTITAVSDTISWCVTLPSPYSFFRLSEGLSPLSAGNPVTFTSMVFTTNVLSLQWTAPPNLRFVAEYTTSLFPPLWQPFPDYITSTNGVYLFSDDGSKTGGPGVTRYYRFFQVP